MCVRRRAEKNTRANGERKKYEGCLQLHTPVQRAGVSKGAAQSKPARGAKAARYSEPDTEGGDRGGAGRPGLRSAPGLGGPETATYLSRAILVTAPRDSHARPPAAGPVAAVAPLQVPFCALDRAEPQAQPEVRGRRDRTRDIFLPPRRATAASGPEASWPEGDEVQSRRSLGQAELQVAQGPRQAGSWWVESEAGGLSGRGHRQAGP